MPTTINDYINVAQKLREVGGQFPDGIAFLPENFEAANSVEEFVQAEEAATVKTLFRGNNIPVADIWDRSQRPRYIQNNGFEWVAPTIFVSLAVLSNNAHVLSVGLNVLSNYLTDIFKGMGGSQTVKLKIVVEKAVGSKEISYSGPPEGLKDLPEVIRSVSDS